MNKKIMIAISILIVVTIILGILNNESIEVNRELNESAKFVVSLGETEKIYTLEEIKNLGQVDFQAVKDTSNSEPTEYTYTGVLLKTILEDAGMDLESQKSVIVKAADGYQVAITIKKILDDDNVYLTYLKDGESLGTKEAGGEGPLMVVIKNDMFSQFWCKYAMEASGK